MSDAPKLALAFWSCAKKVSCPGLVTNVETIDAAIGAVLVGAQVLGVHAIGVEAVINGKMNTK